jgi:hypothetical protein
MKNRSLYTVFLRVDLSSQSLTKTALAQLLLKVIHNLGESCTEKEIRKLLRSILRTDIDPQRISEVINQLHIDNKLKKEQQRYRISTSYQKKLTAAYAAYETRIAQALERYFGAATTPLENIRSWFEDVTIAFFTHYSDEWLNSICKTTSKTWGGFNLDDFLKKEHLVKNNIADADHEWLKKQYATFIGSSDRADQAILWDFGTSVFSSTLITANLAVDKLTIDTFRNSIFILDTNALMYLELEEGDLYSSMGAMGKILRGLNITPAYFTISRSEYEGAMQAKRQQALQVIEKYSLPVLKESEDEFLQTALSRGCYNADDINRFFDEISCPPDSLGEDLPIKCLDDEALDTAIKDGSEDDKLTKSLNEIFRERHSFDKKESNLRHDAGMIAGAQHLRDSGDKCWILTRDNTLKVYAKNHAVRDEDPIALCIYTLINLLAINNGGVDVEPEELTPLFADMVKRSLMPEEGVFRVEDLSIMADVQNQISQLPDDEVIDIARKVNRKRMSGVSNEALAHEMNRDFQRAKLKIRDDLDSTKRDLQAETERRERAEGSKSLLETTLRDQTSTRLKGKYRRELILNWCSIIILLPILILILVVALGLNYFSEVIPVRVLAISGLSLNILFWLFPSSKIIHPKLLRNYREKTASIASSVETEIATILKGNGKGYSN